MITLAVFDMAGTTIDDGGAVYEALRLAVEETGVWVSPEDLQTWMGAEKRAAITALVELGGGDPNDPVDKVDRAFDRFRELLTELCAQPMRVQPSRSVCSPGSSRARRSTASRTRRCSARSPRSPPTWRSWADHHQWQPAGGTPVCDDAECVGSAHASSANTHRSARSHHRPDPTPPQSTAFCSAPLPPICCSTRSVPGTG